MVKSQGEGGLDDPVCGCLLCRKGGKEGVHTPFASSNSDWLLRSKSPITELTYLQWWRRENKAR